MSRWFFKSTSSLRVETDVNGSGVDGPRTYACWFKKTSSAVGGQSLFYIGDKDLSTQFHELGVDNATRSVLMRVNDGVADTQAISGGLVKDYHWHHACGVLRSGTTDRSAYLDGTFRGNNTTAAQPNPAIFDRSAIGLNHNVTPTDQFIGYIAHSATWNIALDDWEIRALAQGARPWDVRRAHLRAWYLLMRMNSKHSGTVDTEYDHSIIQANHLATGNETYVSSDDPPPFRQGRPRGLWVSHGIRGLPPSVSVEGNFPGISYRTYQRNEIVRNQTNKKIYKGKALYAAGARGGVIGVGLALANSNDTMPAIGLATEDIAIGGVGRVTMYGLLEMSTFKYNLGDRLFVSAVAPGDLTTVAPVAPNIAQMLAIVMTRSESLTATGIGRGVMHINAGAA